jgi:hypothetical protein
MPDERPAGMEPVKKVAEKRRRKPYRTPEVREHGTVEEITGNIGSGNGDEPIGSGL